MKNFLLLILIISFGILNFQDAGIIMSYTINKGYISEFLCINKDKPQLKCQGKCHLKKMVKENKEEEKNPVQNITERTSITIFCQNLPSGIPFPEETQKNLLPNCADLSDQNTLSTLFRPPIV